MAESARAQPLTLGADAGWPLYGGVFADLRVPLRTDLRQIIPPDEGGAGIDGFGWLMGKPPASWLAVRAVTDHGALVPPSSVMEFAPPNLIE